jgi:hypothetical protein
MIFWMNLSDKFLEHHVSQVDRQRVDFFRFLYQLWLQFTQMILQVLFLNLYNLVYFTVMMLLNVPIDLLIAIFKVVYFQSLDFLLDLHFPHLSI